MPLFVTALDNTAFNYYMYVRVMYHSKSILCTCEEKMFTQTLHSLICQKFQNRILHQYQTVRTRQQFQWVFNQVVAHSTLFPHKFAYWMISISKIYMMKSHFDSLPILSLERCRPTSPSSSRQAPLRESEHMQSLVRA